MNAYVVVESETPAEIFRRLLPQELLVEVWFAVASPYSITSRAHSLLSHRRKPVAVVVNLPTVDPNYVRDRRQSLEELITLVSGSLPVKILVAAPGVEAALFHAPGVLEKLLGRPVPPDLLALARTDPAAALRQLTAEANGQPNPIEGLKTLDGHDLDLLRSAPVIQELAQFLKHVQDLAGRSTP